MGTQNNPPLTRSQLARLARNSRGEMLVMRTKDTASQVMETLREALPKIERFCRERPVAAIGIGVIVGFGLSALLSRRRHRDD